VTGSAGLGFGSQVPGQRHIGRRLFALLSAALLLGPSLIPAAAQEPDRPIAFRVCQDPNNLPFSNLKGEGFENRIAELFAKRLGVPLEYYSFPQRLGFIRNTLRYKMPEDSNFRCDVVLGVPQGYDQVSATKPYFRSTYFLVYVQGRGLDNIRSQQDLQAMDPKKLHALRIGVFDRSPASEWLARQGLSEQGVPYQMLNADPDYYPGQMIEKDLLDNKIDAAIAWGPIAGYVAKKLPSAKLVLVPLKSQPGVQFEYAISMGVRHGEPEWKAVIEKMIAENESKIQDILRDYGIPLLDQQGELIK
jgi:mxaJ protein